MGEFATIDRYCAIENTNCRKSIKFNGPWTYFFAYASSKKMESWTKELVSDLAKRGIRGKRWEDISKPDLIFSTVCEQIHANDFLLAEVTQLNLNVLLEIGYALAVGRHPLLIQDKNRESWKRDILTTMESCFYATRQDVLEHIARWQTVRSLDTIGPNKRLQFLENMGIFDDQEVRETAYHLKPKVSTDWIGSVDKSFFKSPFKLTSMDPSDSVSDEFYPQARQIQRASLIVASLVSTEHRDFVKSNANVALLVGFSIGLGKKVLVLQEEPRVQILDLDSVSRPFETEHQVQQIVDAWINNQTRISERQSVESERQASSRQQADELRKLYLGHPDALQDTELHKYFVPTKEFYDAVEGRRTIFVGRRGSGKSANFREVIAEISKKNNIVPVEVLPDDYQLEQITGLLKKTTHLPDSRLVFQSIWNYVLTTEILKAIGENTTLLYQSFGDTSRNNLNDIYEGRRSVFDEEFGSRTASTLKKVLSLNSGMPYDEDSRNTEEAFKSLRDYDLNRQLKQFAEDAGVTFFIVADDLDKHWNVNTRQSIDLLVGLVAEVARMQKFFGKHIRIALFLREDIFSTLARHDDDLQKRDFLRMGWTKDNLHHLVAVRLDRRDSGQTDEIVWSAIFPELVNGCKASEYILTRSLPRPRDVLKFCQYAIDHAQINGHTYVKQEDIVEGEKEYSDTLFSNISNEFKVQYPDLELAMIEFAGVNERIAWEEFEGIAEKTIRTNMSVMRRWIGGRVVTPYFLTEALFNVGLIGLSRNWESNTHFCNGRPFSEIWGLTSSQPIVHIHPAFHQCLEITPTPSLPPN